MSERKSASWRSRVCDERKLASLPFFPAFSFLPNRQIPNPKKSKNSVKVLHRITFYCNFALWIGIILLFINEINLLCNY